jgi:predicted phosphate transport protein (TIGR00153 family)
MRLLPREEKFFQFFHRQAALTLEAARIFQDAVRAGNSALREAGGRIAKLEGQGDEVIHEVFTRLNQTFITPLDPEDIHSLASDMDDVLDGIEESAHRIVAFRVDPIPPTVVVLAGLIESCAASLQKAFEALEKQQDVLTFCIEINRLEGAADDVVREAIAELFEKESNPITLIKLKEIYEFLELTTDYCEDVADALQNVVVKNS